MPRHIDADALIKELEHCSYETWSKGVNRAWWAQAVKIKDNIKQCIERQPTADVVEVEVLKEWLYKIALNNVGCTVGDFSQACEEIIARLKYLRVFAKERSEG